MFDYFNLHFEPQVNKNIRHLHDCKGQLFATVIVSELLFFSWKYTVITMYLLALWVSATKNWTFVTFDDGFLTVIRDHAQWSLTRNQKQNDAYFWP